jgi:hypothetical protein
MSPNRASSFSSLITAGNEGFTSAAKSRNASFIRSSATCTAPGADSAKRFQVQSSNCDTREGYRGHTDLLP